MSYLEGTKSRLKIVMLTEKLCTISKHLMFMGIQIIMKGPSIPIMETTPSSMVRNPGSPIERKV